MALNFLAIETALAAWLQAATGLASTRTNPNKQKTPQTAMPYMTFSVPVPEAVWGGPDEVQSSFNGAAPAGQEVTVQVVGSREFVASVQVFTLSAAGGTDYQGNLTAREYISRAQTALARPSILAALSAAGLVFVEVESVNDFSDRLGPVGQGRAAMDVRFRCIDVVADTPGPYIQTAPIGAAYT